MKYAKKKTFRKAAIEILALVDKCLTTRQACDCYDTVEAALKRLVKELTSEKGS